MLHAHVNDPVVSAHVAVLAQLCIAVVHSLNVAQVMPLPEYPALHAHVNDPTVSVHVPRTTEHVCVPSVHSLLFMQVVPTPV